MPESLLVDLRSLGHQVDSVNHLKLKGIDNGTLYRQVARDYDLCFTRDAGFAHNVQRMREQSQVKVLRVVVPQQRVETFVPAFVDAFENSDWSLYTPPALTGLKKACGWCGLNHRAADERVNPLPYELAQAMEPELARQLRADGLAVWQN